MAPAPNPKALATRLLAILKNDRERLLRIDDYLHGNHDDPYMPPNADAEYRLLADRSVSNWMPLLASTPCQSLYVDGFRRGALNRAKHNDTKVATEEDLPEWNHWERSNLSARQSAIHAGAVGYGHSFTVTERGKGGRLITKGLSPLRTSALFEDPANDLVPYASLYVVAWPKPDQSKLGVARMWDDSFEYKVTFDSFETPSKVNVVRLKKHGASENPCTRFAASIDLEGRTVGVIEPMIPLQNRINQTVFDLLVAQTYGSFKVRWVTGMAPPVERDWETGEPILDDQGNPKPLPINHNARRFLFAEDADVHFGSLDETPLEGFINSIDMSIRHLAAVSQTPPHYLLGQIANLSAEALLAAETSLQRLIESFRKNFGESWERVFRLAAELSGDMEAADDYHGEVLWRDMESKSLAQSADALGKLKDQLDIPARGLWRRVPGVTENEIQDWEHLAEKQDPEGQLADALQRATPGSAGIPPSPSQ